MSITPVYLSIKTLDIPCYAGLPIILQPIANLRFDMANFRSL
ncbi:MAG: hypothetical protein WBA89_00310 [Microcoleus sp.]